MDMQFKRPDGFDPLAYVMQSIATMPRRFAFELLLKTDLDTAHREVFDVLGVLETVPEGVLLRGSVEDLDWLARQISIFSFDFLILDPAELKEELEKHSSKLSRMANNAEKRQKFPR
jgi:predicted DNA-binding transcriptional regulator YafY